LLIFHYVQNILISNKNISLNYYYLFEFIFINFLVNNKFKFKIIFLTTKMYTESFVEDFTDKKIALENVYSVIKTAIECNRIF